MFAENIAVANNDLGGFSAITQVLRSASENATGPDLIIAPNCQRTNQVGIGTDDRPRSDDDGAFHNGIGANPHIVPQDGFGADNGRRMNPRAVGLAHRLASLLQGIHEAGVITNFLRKTPEQLEIAIPKT
jgi:hypothetical protein